MEDAKTHIKANRMKVKERVATRRGVRINVVDADGKPKTLVVLKNDS
jgi:hypothetical protein